MNPLLQYSADAVTNAVHLSTNGISKRLPKRLACLRWAERLRLFAGNAIALNHYYLLRCGLAQTQQTPLPKLGLEEMRRLTEDDFCEIYDQLHALDYPEKKEILACLRFYQHGFQNCYGLKDNGRVTCFQWIIYPSENELIKQARNSRYLLLKPNQVIFANAFTFPADRDRGLNLSLSAELMRLACAQGYTNAICCLRKDNLAALNDCLQLGFQLVKIIPECKIFGWVRRPL